MILRYDRVATELPPPSDPDPAGAAAVQELMGGRFGEMSTFMNYTFQSFNFRGRQGARPFYDLVANIAAEEFGHIELVATAINTMLTGATPTNGRSRTTVALRSPLAGVKGVGNPQHFLAGGQGALPQDSTGKPWTGLNVFSSGDLVEDLTHNFFLETGARNNKLKVYEMVEHPVARALTGYLLVRGGVHQVAYARALENLTGADLMKLFPVSADPNREDPRVQAAHQARRSPAPLPILPAGLSRARGSLQRPTSGNGRGTRRRRRGTRGRPATRPSAPAGRLRTRLRARRTRRDREEAPSARRPAERGDGSRRRIQRHAEERRAEDTCQGQPPPAESSREALTVTHRQNGERPSQDPDDQQATGQAGSSNGRCLNPVKPRPRRSPGTAPGCAASALTACRGYSNAAGTADTERRAKATRLRVRPPRLRRPDRSARCVRVRLSPFAQALPDSVPTSWSLGGTNAVSRIVYGLVGLAGLYLAVTLLAGTPQVGRPRCVRSTRPPTYSSLTIGVCPVSRITSDPRAPTPRPRVSETARRGTRLQRQVSYDREVAR